MRIRSLVIIGVSVFVGKSVLGTTIHIPADYPTIQQGINAAANGDTVLVGDGTYTENINFLGKTILVISDNGPNFTTIEIANSGSPVVSFISGEGRNSILEGFTVTGDLSYWGVYCNASSPSIIGNILTHHEAGFKVENGGPLIRGNDISLCEHVDISLNKGAGIYIDGGSGALIDSNVIHHNLAHVAPGLVVDNAQNIVISHNQLYSNVASDYASCMGFYGTTDMDIINNTVANNNGPNNNLGSLNFTSCNNVHIINNIVAFNTDWGILNFQSSTVYVEYSNVYGNGAGNIGGISPGTGCISLDPLFVGGDPFDYHLLVGSPCIDAGDPDSPLDPDGSIADMGALYSGEVITNFGFDIEDVYGENAQPIEVPVNSHGLAEQAIAGLEFHISFDNTCLQYDTSSSDYFSDLLINVVDDEINILWEDYENPVTLPDSSQALALHFTALGQLGDTCSISWFGNSEIVDSLGNVVPGIQFNDGSVRVIEFHSIGGRVIYYDMLTPLEDIDMELSGDWTSSTTTDQNGQYQFENLFPGDFTICPVREDDDPGVTVSDVIKIRRQLVQLELFDSPYKYVAADVNQSDYISVADIIKIRRYLAGLEALPSGNWAFVDSSYAISDENWMDAPGCIDFSIWDADLADSSFIGVRMGDVDVTLGFNSGPPVIADNVMLDLIDAQGSPGDTVTVPLRVQGFVDVAGIEIHLGYPEENLNFVQLNSGIISGYTLNSIDGELHLVWEDIDNTVTLPTNAELLSISFEIQPGTIDDVPVGFNSAYVVNSQGIDFNVYSSDANIDVIPLGLNDNSELPNEYCVHQNYPNPFNARTIIKFDLPQSSQVKIEIYDLLGRRIETLVDSYLDAGYHDVNWNAEDYPSGIYFYTMKAGEYAQSHKMMLLK